MSYGEEQSEGLPKSSFPIYVAEGDVLFKQGEYAKALESYSTALEIEPSDRNCLVARSKCHLQLGDAKAALKDAEESLKEEPDFHKGLYQKAEALYQMGDFEMGLVFYHRGNKLRPELQEFRLGIQKAQEAIDNSIGSPAKVKLENKGDLSFFYKQDESKSKKPPRMGYSKPSTKPREDQKKRKTRKEKSDKEKEITKQLLGELYSDKQYLDRLLKDQDLTRSDTESGNRIYDLVSEGLDYLDTRTEFWRQQKPMYARKREKVEAKGQRDKNKQKPVDPTKYILKNLEEIDKAMADGHAKEALKQAQRTLKTVEGWHEDDVPDKSELIANLHSCIGNAYLDLSKMPDALHHHQKDLKISKDNDNEDGKSRAYDNLGRVYARIGKFDAAVEHWTLKLPLVKTSLEATWLYHEIGRCHLELGNFQEARDFGEKSLKAAQEAKDDMWQLNASVLIAQSEVKLGDLQEAIESFERSLEMAKLQGDEPAQSAISKALEELNDRIVQGLKEKDTDTNKIESKTKDEEKKEVEKEQEDKKPEPVEKEEVSSGEEESDDETKVREQYHIYVTTGDDRGAGTDARVSIIISGEDGQTGKIYLDNSVTEGDKFEAGHTDKFEITAKNVGEITHIKIGHNGKGFFSGWKLDKVNINVPATEKEYNFQCNMWLDKDEGDGKIKRILHVVDDDDDDDDDDGEENYQIHVTTGDVRGSGTDAKVFVVIYGKKKDTGRLYLEKSENHSDKFEPGNTDEFLINGQKVGKIRRIRIGHDGEGMFSGWMCDKVEVFVPAKSKSYVFTCGQWLDRDEGDGKIERELTPEK